MDATVKGAWGMAGISGGDPGAGAVVQGVIPVKAGTTLDITLGAQGEPPQFVGSWAFNAGGVGS